MKDEVSRQMEQYEDDQKELGKIILSLMIPTEHIGFNGKEMKASIQGAIKEVKKKKEIEIKIKVIDDEPKRNDREGGLW